MDGPTVNTKWGPVQVEAIFATDGTLCDVTALQSPDAHGKSVRINDRALPILHDRVIAAQGTKIFAVSGATITSNAYAASLQSILDAHPVT
ncbi:MAG: FMN-binding protein [Acidimicrobiia bacterium]